MMEGRCSNSPASYAARVMSAAAALAYAGSNGTEIVRDANGSYSGCLFASVLLSSSAAMAACESPGF